jgi:hypothetical protein
MRPGFNFRIVALGDRISRRNFSWFRRPQGLKPDKLKESLTASVSPPSAFRPLFSFFPKLVLEQSDKDNYPKKDSQ